MKRLLPALAAFALLCSILPLPASADGGGSDSVRARVVKTAMLPVAEVHKAWLGQTCRLNVNDIVDVPEVGPDYDDYVAVVKVSGSRWTRGMRVCPRGAIGIAHQRDLKDMIVVIKPHM